MPRKSSGRPEVTPDDKPRQLRRYVCPPDALWGGFINIRLSDSQRDDFHQWEASNAAHIGAMHEDHLYQGIKSSIAYDDENEAFIVTYTGRLVDMVQSRYSVSSRSSSLHQALALAVYKHDVMGEGDYKRFSSGVKEFMQFG
jgi:hypothetical protein